MPSSRRSRGRIGRTVNPVPSCSFNVSTLTDLLTSVITSVVHDLAAPVAQYLGAIDTLELASTLQRWAEGLAVKGVSMLRSGQTAVDREADEGKG